MIDLDFERLGLVCPQKVVGEFYRALAVVSPDSDDQARDTGIRVSRVEHVFLQLLVWHRP